MELRRTGRMVEFLSISIGSPFWAHNRFWVRTNREVGTELRTTNVSQETKRGVSSCNFNLDECDRFVEAVEIV